MISPLAVLCVLALAALGEAHSTLEHLSIKYQKDDLSILDHDLPRNKAQIEEEGWEELEFPEAVPEIYRNSLTMYSSPQGPSLGLMLDDLGIVVGMHIAIDSARVSNNVYNSTVQGFYKWQKTWNGTLTDYLATYVIYKPADELIQYPGFNGPSIVLSTDMSKNTGFYKQNCVENRGVGYYFNMKPTLSCASRSMLPFYTLTTLKSNICGFGFYMNAELAVLKGERSFWIKYPDTIVSEDLNSYPKCMEDTATKPGYMGVEFQVKKPSTITCA